MRYLRYLTHPQVRIDAAVPVPLWGLSDVGRARVEATKHILPLDQTELIVSSMETKAIETAAILANHWNISIFVKEAAHENDRSATGFLPPPEFEKMADAFFAEPEKSIRGWERAIDAQTRIIAIATDAVAAQSEGDILFVGHGGVGTLLFCHLACLPIQRIRDQPAGGGNMFCYNVDTQKIVHGWIALESAEQAQLVRP